MNRTDKRYGSRRWKATRLRVLNRDLWRCWVGGCAVSASVADHIDPATLDMPSARFFDETNLRASCKRHNTARGVAARLEREVSAEPGEPRNPLTAPLYRSASPLVARDAAPSRPRVAYHLHTRSSGVPILTGYMTNGQSALDRCPSNCTVPGGTD